MECKPWREYDAGDHVLFIGEIQELHFENLEALTFYQGKMGSAKLTSKAAEFTSKPAKLTSNHQTHE
ncbi:flavin reductase family protein [Peribacillus castrilensis]|uniref:flavin reductase family protein n=1 Tax=Peribacillus TaxID=2675229 RepID=UPI00093011B2|nr:MULTISPECIES: flavin reductase family protein [Bacillaceae]